MWWKSSDLEVRVLFSQAGLATQILVQAGEVRLLFDAGDGTLRDLLHIGVSPKILDGVFLTHGHADHVAGLYGLLGFLRAEGHDRLFRVWYPAGCCEVDQLVAAFRACHADSLPYPLETQALCDGQGVGLGEVEVLAMKVEHWHSIRGRLLSPAPALAYRITFRSKTVVISGDTAPCPALYELVKGADLALIEATLAEDAPEDQRTHLHLTRSAAREVARLAHRAWFIHTPGSVRRPGCCHPHQPDV